LPWTTGWQRAGLCAAIAALPIKPHMATTLAATIDRIVASSVRP
jgi:hypothetical protein